MRWLLLLVLLVGCDEGPEPSLEYGGVAACDDPAHGTEAWFTDRMLPEFFTPYCLYCHSSEREGEQRHGAPASLNFDEFDSATSINPTTWARVASAEMPPLGRLPSQDEYAMLLDFLECTAVDNTALTEALGDCEEPEPVYAEVESIFDEHCTRCHHSGLSGADRSGAPDGLDWDSAAAIRGYGPHRLWARIFSDTMPQDRAGDGVLVEQSPQDARALHAYLSCNAPD